jgi:DMSO reductase anchor subunit
MRRGLKPPTTYQSGTAKPISPGGNAFPKHEPRVSLRTEWPLLVFTLTASILVALFHSWILADIQVPSLSYAMAGLAAMGLSTSHLGKRLRFYRAIYNWRRSWVSREILLFTAFFAGAVYCQVVAPEDAVLARVVAAVGFVALFSMDKVYQLETNLSRAGLHSASVLLTSLYLVGIFTMHPWFVPPLALVKLVLYLLRRLPNLRRKSTKWKVLFVTRIVAGYAVPGLLWVLTGPAYYELIVSSILVGEIVDRAEYYMELDFTRPATLARTDLHKMIASKPLVLT